MANLMSIMSTRHRIEVDPEIGTPQLSSEMVAPLRDAMDGIVRSHLSAVQKTRFCDKSIGTWRYFSFLRQLYPRSKFVCLYRHPMDFMRSSLEACPWGLSGYGFEPYVATSPGNSVDALARYWMDHTVGIMKAAELQSESCHVVRYEDLADAPEEVTARLFEFLEVSPQPGITSRCFSSDRDRTGPSDYKIWFTAEVHSSSIGRGDAIPATQIQPGLRDAMNGVLDRLGYVRVGPAWGTPGSPSDPRVAGTAPPSEHRGTTARDSISDREIAARLRARAQMGVESIDDDFRRRWSPFAGGPAALVLRAGGSAEAHYVIDIERGDLRGDDDDDNSFVWCIVGAPEVWHEVLSGEMNLAVASRQGTLRYCGPMETDRQAIDRRMLMISELLALSRRTSPGPAQVATEGIAAMQ